MTMNTQFLKTAVEAAKAAGAIQKKSYGKVRKIDFKGEINLVTEVDKACEEKILKILRKNHPEHDILTEETGLVAAREAPIHSSRTRGAWGDGALKGQRSPQYRWIVDPLDGTTNYAHGYPCFCVSIGLEHKGRVIAGVVYHPILDEMFWAVRGKGAYLNRKKIRVSSIKALKRSLLATGFAYNVHTTQNDNIDHFTHFIKTAQAVRRDGAAAIDMCYIACGRFEGFWELGLKPWDIAAASLILEEAGGRSTLFQGQKLDLYADEIVASNGLIHREMISVLSKR